MASHRLDPLLRPQSIALIGASPRPDTVGSGMVTAATAGASGRRVYFINPAYAEIAGRPCYPDFAALPEAVDLAVIGVANQRAEAALRDAAEHGARAAVIFGSAYLPDDTTPPLTARLTSIADAAGMAICGANCMGFYNLAADLRVCGFPPPDWVEPGPLALITHSGTVFSALCHNDRRLRFGLAVSAGQELVTTAADYLDFALAQDEIRCVGLFLETIRDPARFVAALETARAKRVPVVALKVGRTAASAAMAASHSGAVAGDHAAYRALFERHGVIEVDNLDDFANALRLFSSPRCLAAGGLASMHDSGGLRELMVDLAEETGVPFAAISSETGAKLAARLDYGLDPSNPLDAWGTGHDYEAAFADLMTALLDDADTALGMLCAEIRDDYYLVEGYTRAMRAAYQRSGKPVVISTNVGSGGSSNLAARLTAEGIPVLSGIASSLRVVGKAMTYRDWLARPVTEPEPVSPHFRAKWAPRLKAGGPLTEAESLSLLSDYQVPTLPFAIVTDAAGARAAAAKLGWPVVLKTAMPGILHKSDVGGVHLNLRDETTLDAAYADLATRLGSQALVMPMARPGIELAFGGVIDPQFGALAMIGAGGTLIELLDDRQIALAPLDPVEAGRRIEALRLKRLLDGYRGAAPADRTMIAKAFSRFCLMLRDLADLIAECDLNPVIATAQGCVAVDALIIPRQAANDSGAAGSA
ncbi:MAG TPA: acetate--CoA ligase family protein [Dongiaceae bacterium]|nr:acetate--CoA ligase family protein [Dongiaceae bacterium]